MPTSWERIGEEGETVFVAPDSTVRYGATADGLHVERVMSGPVFIHNSTFTDPQQGVKKALWLRSAAETPTPEPVPPAPSPSPEPDMPSELPFSIPPHPGNPPTEAPSAANAAVWTIYIQRLRAHLDAAMAVVRHDDEVACAAATNAHAAAQQAMAAALRMDNANMPKTRREMIWDYLKTIPPSVHMTENTMVGAAAKMADEFITKHGLQEPSSPG